MTRNPDSAVKNKMKKMKKETNAVKFNVKD